ncbi:MAG: hypothetical protein Q7J07_03910 [Pelolinea sp.]|nr:hypothetical protein [Pelolinea sp.]
MICFSIVVPTSGKELPITPISGAAAELTMIVRREIERIAAFLDPLNGLLAYFGNPVFSNLIRPIGSKRTHPTLLFP